MKSYSVKEIAEMLNTNQETVRRWIRSGRLEAIQSSRKGGNIVTEDMLNTFLEKSPKYASIASNTSVVATTAVTLGAGAALAVGAMPLLGGVALGAAIGSCVATRRTEAEIQDTEKQIDTEELRQMLLENIKKAEANINRKKETIRNLEEEIEIEERNIKEATKIMNMLGL